jgi:hypothetical protein
MTLSPHGVIVIVGFLLEAETDGLVVLFKAGHLGTGLFVAELSGVETVQYVADAMGKKGLINRGLHRILEIAV